VEFGYSYLTAYMFCLSLGLGGLFLVLIHHLFDAGWSVPLRRLNEHLACLLPVMAVLFIPIAVLAPKLYPWMQILDPATDHALHSKHQLLNKGAWYGISALLFVIWTALSWRLRSLSLEQDRTGDASCTRKLRVTSAIGMFLFAISLTLAAMLWVKSLEHQWFSTMYGVYYFAGSVWTTLATVYVIAVVLKRNGPLAQVMGGRQFHDLGVLWFAFTVFYAYIHFSQYFIIWNANLPEETFYYTLRERGSWYGVGMVLIFGHFFLPFLALLRIDAKHHFTLMAFFAGWAWLMHYLDLSFNIMPTPHPEGFPFAWVWLDLGCLALIGGVLAKVFLKHFRAHAPYPVRDPRLGEALGLYHPKPRLISGGELGETEDLEEPPERLPGSEAKGGAQ
jgi:magnesium-transporting ATPase (P-type)